MRGRDRPGRARREGRAVVALLVALPLLDPSAVAVATVHPHGPAPGPSLAVAAGRADPAPQASSDSTEIRAGIRSAQRRLERIRERHMPTAFGGTGRCDEIVGRFCVWHEPDESWEPPADAPALTEARERFLERAAAAAAALPGDGWIAGQRVRYLQEAGRHDAALRAARECRASAPGWCEALEGYALHGAGKHERADSAFAVALARMPAEERCRWSNATDLLDGRARKAYGRLGCGERAPFEARLWWLADPLYLVPGNERRAEHLWRRVMDRLQEGAASGYRVGWGRDLRELPIRYGWPAGWERVRPPPGRLPGGEISTVAHDPTGARRFVPRGRWIEAPTTIGREEWELKPRRPRSHYAAAYAREFAPLRVAVARFRRGDTAIVVAGLPATGEDGTGCADREVGLFVAAGPGGPTGEARSRGDGPASLMAALPGGRRSALVSVESLCRPAARAARARFGLQLPSAEPGISDLLLGRGQARDLLPSTLSEAAESARGPGPLRPGERVPLYWEVYGTEGTEATAVTVELERPGGGVFRKLAQWTGLAGERPPLVGLRWADRRPEPGIWTRSVGLEVPEDAPRGRYELRVTVRLDGGLPLRASRTVRVEEAEGDAK